MLGQVATHTLRNYGIPCSQYIDDRHLGKLRGTQIKRNSSFDAAICAFFVAGTLLTQLGNFLHFAKCISIPQQRLIFLGRLVDTVRQTFSLPGEKKQKFVALREKSCPLSRFPSTCCNVSRENVSLLPSWFPQPSFTLGHLYTLAGTHAISRAQRLGIPIKLEGDLREEGFSGISGRAVPLGASKNTRLSNWWHMTPRSAVGMQLYLFPEEMSPLETTSEKT